MKSATQNTGVGDEAGDLTAADIRRVTDQMGGLHQSISKFAQFAAQKEGIPPDLLAACGDKLREYGSVDPDDEMKARSCHTSTWLCGTATQPPPFERALLAAYADKLREYDSVDADDEMKSQYYCTNTARLDRMPPVAPILSPGRPSVGMPRAFSPAIRWVDVLVIAIVFSILIALVYADTNGWHWGLQ